MATRQRPADRGSETGRRLISALAREFQNARRDRGLSLRTVADAVAVSPATVWRFERGLSPNVTVLLVARLLAVVGLDLGARAYAGPTVLRDAGQGEVVAAFQSLLHSSLRWGSEVPLPGFGDARRWDGLITGRGWRYGVEAETGPQDAQALAGRLNLKVRDRAVDGHARAPRNAAGAGVSRGGRVILGPLFPVRGPVAVARLRVGLDPGGSAIVLVQRHRRVSPGEPTRTGDGEHRVPTARAERGALPTPARSARSVSPGDEIPTQYRADRAC